MPNGGASPVHHQEDANVDEFLKQLLDGPSMRFDETLLRPVECGGVQIPVPLGAVFVTLHRKHNEQMSGEPFYSFLQDGNFDYNISSDMEDAELGATLDTLVSSNITLEECYNTLDKYDAGALYRLLYRLMRRLSFKPFPISGRSCEIISTIDLFDDTDPVLRGHLKFWEKEPIGMEFEQPESFQLPEIDDKNRKKLVRETINVWQWRHERIRAMNMLNNCLFHDQLLVEDVRVRHMLRFIVANLVELVKSYAKKAFKEELLPNDAMLHVAALMLHPVEMRRIICRIARTFSQVLFRLEINWVTNKVRQYPYRQDRVTWAWERAIWDMQAHILKNALCVNYSNFWNPRVELKEKIIHDNKECNQAACACRFFVNPALP
ncbi:expressed conserved protein [Echinococcus multilocularis]|uniref:Expressed conserved protein n=1 Tax=Echinococcus multilocularis TaxID=6211 RepID=A0A068YGE4_ECHMU|nr:expressed conserved protein [Echinococcus multilocularis]